jgi:oligoribonuclease NrnB/cAMP/cGMP phosphodiesterase (DHH superfamily)
VPDTAAEDEPQPDYPTRTIEEIAAEQCGKCVEDRDLWRLALPNAREYMTNVYAAPMTFEAWDILHGRATHKRHIDLMIDRGSAILEYMQEYGAKALAEARLLEWHQLPARVIDEPIWSVNLPYMNCSDYLTRLLEEKCVTSFVAGYFRRADGRWQFSLRSAKSFDCSEVAKVYGGGGHKQAAGFDVADLSEVFA